MTAEGRFRPYPGPKQLVSLNFYYIGYFWLFPPWMGPWRDQDTFADISRKKAILKKIAYYHILGPYYLPFFFTNFHENRSHKMLWIIMGIRFDMLLCWFYFIFLNNQLIPVEYFLYRKSRQAMPPVGGAIRFSKNISENKLE